MTATTVSPASITSPSGRADVAHDARSVATVASSRAKATAFDTPCMITAGHTDPVRSRTTP